LVSQGTNIFYGVTASGGGSSEAGTVFKLDSEGNETVLYSFTGGADGGGPQSLVLGPDGNLYGTAQIGGAHNAGVIFRLDPTAQEGKETVLYSFTNGADGGLPSYALVVDHAGNLYGTTRTGGDLTCFQNGGYGCGVVFEVGLNGKETVLHSFTGHSDGAFPDGLILDTTGNLYGTAAFGGKLGCLAGQGYGCGVVFKLDSNGQETVLYDFSGGGAKGLDPYGALLLDKEGNLYGTTMLGGGMRCSGDPGGVWARVPVPYEGCGIAFELNAAGQEIVLHKFKGIPDGAQPNGDLVQGPGGLYGTTMNDGGANCGSVFRIDSGGHYVVVYSFTCGADGAYPEAGLLVDAQGNLYGTTIAGGFQQCRSGLGCGTVFKITLH
jgi:uncharacterized repeat protein (TIGR03803 family)